MDANGEVHTYLEGDPNPCEAPEVSVGRAQMACTDWNGEVRTYLEGDPYPCADPEPEVSVGVPL